MSLWGGLAILCLLAAPARAVDPDEVGYLLELGQERDWRDALRAVLAVKHPTDDWLRSALKRLQVLTPSEQAAFFEKYARARPSLDAAAVTTVRWWGREGTPAVREAAWKLLLNANIERDQDLGPLYQALSEAGEHRAPLVERLVWLHGSLQAPESERWTPSLARRKAQEGVRAPDLVRILKPFAEADDDASVRLFLTEAVKVADPEIDALLWSLASGKRREDALSALVLREDPKAAHELFDLQLARLTQPEDTFSTGLRWGGRPYVVVHAFERYRAAKGTSQERALEAFLLESPESDFLHRLEELGTRAQWEAYLEDSEPVIRASVQRVLDAAKREEEQNAPQGPVLVRATLAICAAMSAVMGLAVLAWGLRLLQLRRLLLGTPPLPISSAALGTAALRGEVHPLEDEGLAHPVTGELCVHYPRSILDPRPQRFWLVDESGRICVDARGAILLSEDDILVPGERVQILGEVRRTEGPEPALELVRPAAIRSFAQRVAHLLIHGALGAGARRGQARLLFVDPRAALIIWDDLGESPLAAAAKLYLVVGVFAFAGAWIVLFALLTLGLVDGSALLSAFGA